MSELTTAMFDAVAVTNDQRHDAALTIAEYFLDEPQTVRQMLEIMGLAFVDVDGLSRSLGVGDWELPWFIRQDSCGGSREPRATGGRTVSLDESSHG